MLIISAQRKCTVTPALRVCLQSGSIYVSSVILFTSAEMRLCEGLGKPNPSGKEQKVNIFLSPLGYTN